MKKLLTNFVVILLVLEALYYLRMAIFNYKTFKFMSTNGELSSLNWFTVFCFFLFMATHLNFAYSYWSNRGPHHRIMYYIGLPLAGFCGWIFLKILPRVTDWSRLLHGDVVSLTALSSLGYVLIGVSAFILSSKLSQNVSR